MTFPSPSCRRRVCAWASLATLAAMAACSKEDKPASAAAPSSATAPAAAAPALPADATPEQRVIAQARAAVGPEEKLQGMTGVLLVGKIYDDKNVEQGSLLLLFVKPGKQHTELRTATETIIQGSDGSVGWAMGIDKTGNRKLTVLKAPDEKVNLYTTMENLYFYRAADQVQGAVVKYEGDADYRGVKCHKVSFKYPDSITYVRYFDSSTGRLVGTMMLPNGNEVVEGGTMAVNGVNFPAVLNNYNKDGKLTQVVKFEKINLNPVIDPKAKIFDLPDMVALAKTAAAKATATASGSANALPSQAKPGASGSFPSPQSLMKKN